MMDKIIQHTTCKAKLILGNSQNKILTTTAAIPNHKAANAGRISSDKISNMPSTNQCHGSKIKSIIYPSDYHWYR
jgi:hypothetical protein